MKKLRHIKTTLSLAVMMQENYSPNNDQKKWQNKDVEILGFATKDDTRSIGVPLKSAKMQIFSQRICNEKLEQKLIEVDECKLIYT